jgi:hypothetical protein
MFYPEDKGSRILRNFDNFYQATWGHTPVDHVLHSDYREHVTSSYGSHCHIFSKEGTYCCSSPSSHRKRIMMWCIRIKCAVMDCWEKVPVRRRKLFK